MQKNLWLYGQVLLIYYVLANVIISKNIWIDSTLGDVVMMKYFCTATLKEKWCNLSVRIDKNKTFIILLLAWFICVMHPLLHTGVILNDEVQAFFERQNGYFMLLERNIGCELSQGRPLRIMAAFNSSLSFLSSNMVINRGIQIFILGITAVSLAAFVKKIFKDKFISYMTAILFLVCMPITFEHAVPNAFVGLVCVPLICLCWSLYFWINYVKSHCRKYLVLSMLLWCVALCGYEFIVMYTPVFIFLYLHVRKNCMERWYDMLSEVKLPVLLGGAYVTCTLLLQKLYGVGYSGVKIQFESISQSWQIIKTIICSAIPGYFFTNSKYLYLYSIYSDDNLPEMFLQCIDERCFDVYIKMLEMFFLDIGSVHVLLVLLLTSLLILHITSGDNVIFYNKKVYIVILCTCMLLPIIPNSITSLYQGNVNEVSFTSLPVSTFIFATWCIFISILLKIIFSMNRLIKYSCVIALILNVALVQHMNVIFADVHVSDYSHMEKTEKLFKTNLFKRLDGNVIYFPDIFVTRNTLSVGEDYWNKVAVQKGIDLKFTKSNNCNNKLFYIDDAYFSLTFNGEKIIISEKPLNDFVKVRTDDNNYVLARLDTPVMDNGLYIYVWK